MRVAHRRELHTKILAGKPERNGYQDDTSVSGRIILK
jgi:hypothetical protein